MISGCELHTSYIRLGRSGIVHTLIMQGVMARKAKGAGELCQLPSIYTQQVIRRAPATALANPLLHPTAKFKVLGFQFNHFKCGGEVLSGGFRH